MKYTVNMLCSEEASELSGKEEIVCRALVQKNMFGVLSCNKLINMHSGLTHSLHLPHHQLREDEYSHIPFLSLQSSMAFKKLGILPFMWLS